MKMRIWLLASLTILSACNPSKDSEDEDNKLATVGCEIEGSTTQVVKGEQITANLACNLESIEEDLELTLKYDANLINLSASGQAQAQAGSVKITLPKDGSFKSTLNIQGLKIGKSQIDLKVKDIAKKWDFKVVLPNIDFGDSPYPLATGNSHTAFVKADETLWAWGENTQGQLGDGTTTNRNAPVKIGSDQWTSISAGSAHTLGLKTDGTLWAWGENGSRQLGDGSTTNRSTPVKIGSDQWKSISGGGYHSLGLKTDGTLWAWGENGSRQLGDGSTTDRSTPVKIGSDQWKSVSGGHEHSLGLKADGTLWAWGDNGYGQLGDGSTTDRSTPVKIGSDNDWKKISTRRHSSFGIKKNGTLWAWGDNSDGQLGDGSTNDRHAPVQITGIWKSVSSGGEQNDEHYHSLGIKSDGTLWVWGTDRDNQLGLGAGNQRTARPVQLGSDTDWVAVKVGDFYSIAVKSNGEVWTWGYNGSGQLGDGSTTNRNAPVKLSF